MTIYIADIDNNKVLKEDFGDIANLLDFERELNDIYDEEWFYDEEDAVYSLQCYNFAFGDDDISFLS